ncbi:MAG: hypothetical protein IJX17_03835 [Clostridia bacterium]|nr:hypothetical protein [Clostridia bacterium]
MYSDYRFLAKGVAQGDKKFSELEAQTWKLASRNKEYYELCFLSRPYNPKGNNEIKFIQDDVFMDMKTVTVLNQGMPGFKKYKKAIDSFLKKNPTPTLEEFRKLNQELIAEQEMVNCAESQIGMG